MNELFLSCPIDFLDAWIWMREIPNRNSGNSEIVFQIMREGAD